MAELLEQSPGAASAGIAERDAAAASIQAQDSANAANRGDMHAGQVAGRDVAFNPTDTAAATPAAQGRPASGVQQQATQSAGSSGLSAEAQAGQAQAEWQSAMDYARSIGYQVNPRFQDDQSFLLDLIQRADRNTQADYYAQLGQAIAPQYQQVQQYLNQQRGQPQPGQQAARQPWEPPEFNQAWLQLVDRDPASGMFLAKPGADPRIAAAVNVYDQWLQKTNANPVAAMQPYVQQEVPNLVRQEVANALAHYQRQQNVERIVSTNSAWMYANGPDGRPQVGYNGAPVATPAGARYAQHVQTLESQGLRDPVAVDQLARTLLMGEIAMGQQRAAQGDNQVQQQNALASGGAQQNVLQSLPPQQRAITPGATEPSGEGLSLAELLRRNLDSAGYTDANFNDTEFLHG